MPTRLAGSDALPLPNYPPDLPSDPAAALAAFATANGFHVGNGDAVQALRRLRYGDNAVRDRLLWRVIDAPDILTDLIKRGNAPGFHRRAVAVVTHTHGRILPREVPFGIVVDELPRSWKGRGHAYLLRSEPWTRKQELHLFRHTFRGVCR